MRSCNFMLLGCQFGGSNIGACLVRCPLTMASTVVGIGELGLTRGLANW
jgi:hypothetical protein